MVGDRDMLEAPNGIPGVEAFMPLMLNGVVEGWLTLERLAEVTAENPAKIFGLYPRKGVIQPGSDGDLVVVDLDREVTLRDEDQLTACGWTPYDGMKLRGEPVVSIIRGAVAMEDGEVHAQKGYGRYVPRLG
ncbi:amidohydrolase family protein [Candidatus Bathyarchaeota archaeon]|nr:amidohydrolase family protein [Candidatus Bathyarchaeota archaeon]